MVAFLSEQLSSPSGAAAMVTAAAPQNLRLVEKSG
jgi:hypothetical protein